MKFTDEQLIDVKNVQKLARTRGPESRAAEEVASRALRGRYRYVPLMGWLGWDGARWKDSPTMAERVHEDTRLFVDAVQKKYQREAGDLAQAASDHAKAVVTKDGMATSQIDALLRDRKALVGFLQLNHPSEVEPVEQLWALEKDAREQAAIWLNLMSHASIGSLVSLAKRMNGILTGHEELDQYPDFLNVLNGIVDLRTATLINHNPDLLLTKVCNAEFVAQTACPRWTAALQAVHPDLREWFQTRMGQSATGHRPDDDVMPVCIGGGSNGKTTVLNAVMSVLGEYADLVPHKALMGSDPNAHSTELTVFRGLRLAVMEETPEDGHLDMHRVKMTVGTPFIRARKIRQDDITFTTTHSMWINTNHRPQVAGADHGTWRRLVAVPWPFTFVGKNVVKKDQWHLVGDPSLRPDVVDNPSDETKSAILWWLVEGAHRWYLRGRTSPEHPDVVVEASARWRVESDVALLFVQDNLVSDPDGFITGEDMRAAFAQFLTEQGKKAWSASTVNQRLGEAMGEAGVVVTHTPDKVSKVKSCEVQSIRHTVSNFLDRDELPPGKVVRRWVGVRFKTAADNARDRLAAEPVGV